MSMYPFGLIDFLSAHKGEYGNIKIVLPYTF